MGTPAPFSLWTNPLSPTLAGPPLGLLFGDSICRGPTLPPAAANGDGLILHFTLVRVRQKWTHSCFSASLAMSPATL